MIALILNSGLGQRMGVHTSHHPKCMTDLINNETILSRQLCSLKKSGIKEVVITTGYYHDILQEYCESLPIDINLKFVYNPLYAQTNYIYSINCARDYLYNKDFLMLHGDLVFEDSVLNDIIGYPDSCMKVSSTLPLPEKDFKAIVKDNRIMSVGVEFFNDAMEAQAMYKLLKKDGNLWLDKIHSYCSNNKVNCYAEVALNEITDDCQIFACDVKDRLCTEIDTPEDLEKVLAILNNNNM